MCVQAQTCENRPVRVHACAYVLACVYVCVCVTERGGEHCKACIHHWSIERSLRGGGGGGRKRDGETVCVCVSERERVRACV